MHSFEFEYPYYFLLLLLIVCIYKCPVKIKQIIFPHIHYFGISTNWIDREKLFYSLIFTLLITALASPIGYDKKLSQQRKGRDLVFVLDASGSMGESGYSKDDAEEEKFTILKNILRSFISKRYDDNVGVTIFGSFAFASIPITYDMKAVAFLIDFIEVGIAGENTAIGDGIESALGLLQHSHAKNRVIILVTDGYQNSGSTSIQQAVNDAKRDSVKIYTIGIGKKNDFDLALLKRIAQDTDAKSFTAKNAQELQNVYDTLDRLEPSKIKSQNYLNKQILFTYPLALAILLLLYLLSKRGAKWSS